MFIDDIKKALRRNAEKHVVGRRFYYGNRVYYVDTEGIPHTGTVSGSNYKENILNLCEVTNNGDVTCLSVPINWCTKTAEIFLGEPNKKVPDEYFVNRSMRDLQYDRMPKRVNSPKKNSYKYFQVDENMYMLVKPGKFDDPYLCKVQAKSFGTTIVYYLVDTYGYIQFPIGVACKESIGQIFNTNSSLQCTNDEIEEWLSMENGDVIDFKVDVLAVYESDPLTRILPSTEFNKDFMTIVWKNPALINQWNINAIM